MKIHIKPEAKTTLASIFVLGLYFIFLITFWQLGLFEFTGDDASAKIVASSLALIGGLFASLVTLLGIILRQSYERRSLELQEQSEKRLLIETERESHLRKDAERRLRLEAAIEVIKVLSDGDNTKLSQMRNAGAIFTLANLGMMDLATTMMHQMLPLELVPSSAAVWLIDELLESKNEEFQYNAASLLYIHSKHFLEDDGYYTFPACVSFKWELDLPQNARENIAAAVLRVILARPRTEWHDAALSSLVFILNSIWNTETLDYIKVGVGMSLNKILTLFHPNDEILTPNGPLILSKLVVDLEKIKSQESIVPYEFLNSAKQFEDWLSD